MSFKSVIHQTKVLLETIDKLVDRKINKQIHNPRWGLIRSHSVEERTVVLGYLVGFVANAAGSRI